MKRKKILKFISLLMVATLAFGGCKKNEETSDSEPEQQPGSEQPQSNVKLSETSLSLQVAETKTLTVQGAEGTITWTTSSPEIATVENGVVTGVADGTAFITAKAGDEELTCIVVVSGVADIVPMLYLDKSSVKVGIGFTLTLTPYVIVGKEETIVNAADITWTLSDTSVVSVANGMVTGLKAGTVTVQASYEYEGELLKTSCALEVVNYNFYKAYYNDKEISVLNPVLVKVADEYIGTSGTTSATVSIKEVDVITGEEREITSGVSLVSQTPKVAKVDGLTITGGTLNGATEVAIMENGAEMGKLYVKSYAEIVNKAQMDALGLATWIYRDDKATAEAILDGTYVLGNDIDYQKAYIIPIANAVNKYSSQSALYKYYKEDCVDTFLWRDVLSDESVTPADEWAAIKFGTKESTFRTSNPHDLPFTGTFDGNGYEIKNGKMFFANGFVRETPTGSEAYWKASGGCVFGENAGTIKNVAFTDLQYSDTYYGHSKISTETFAGHARADSWKEVGAYRFKDGLYNNAFCGFIYSNKGTISNVRVDAIAVDLSADYGKGNAYEDSRGAFGVRYNWSSGVIENLLINEKSTTFEVKDNTGANVSVQTGFSIAQYGVFGYNAGTVKNSVLVFNVGYGAKYGINNAKTAYYNQLHNRNNDCADVNCNAGTVDTAMLTVHINTINGIPDTNTKYRAMFSDSVWDKTTMQLKKGISNI